MRTLIAVIAGSALAAQAAAQEINLADKLASKGLRPVNREVTVLSGEKRGVHISEREGPGVVWGAGRGKFGSFLWLPTPNSPIPAAERKQPEW